jgi:hypothetical protein
MFFADRIKLRRRCPCTYGPSRGASRYSLAPRAASASPFGFREEAHRPPPMPHPQPTRARITDSQIVCETRVRDGNDSAITTQSVAPFHAFRGVWGRLGPVVRHRGGRVDPPLSGSP